MKRVDWILDRLLKREEYRRSLEVARLWSVWEERFGAEFGRWARLADFKDGRLIIKVKQAVYVHNMSFHDEEIRNELNRLFGKELVREVVFRRG